MEKSAVNDLCRLCDVYTKYGVQGKWNELQDVYNQRQNDDNYKEILNLSAPDRRVQGLTGWHLERMAVGEYETAGDRGSREQALIQKETRQIKQRLRDLLATGQKEQKKRDELVEQMHRQRDVLLHELDAAKDFLGQLHSTNTVDEDDVKSSMPVPVEDRLRAAMGHDTKEG